MTTTASNTDYAAMADYLENLLLHQSNKLRSYDLDGASALAEESAKIADELTTHKVLNQPDFAERKARLRKMYQEICLIIADQRNEVSEKMNQIHHGLRALGGYSGK